MCGKGQHLKFLEGEGGRDKVVIYDEAGKELAAHADMQHNKNYGRPPSASPRLRLAKAPRHSRGAAVARPMRFVEFVISFLLVTSSGVSYPGP